MTHGRRSTYLYHKCRCDPCRAANAAYQYDRTRRGKPIANDQMRRCTDCDTILSRYNTRPRCALHDIYVVSATGDARGRATRDISVLRTIRNVS
jgi:hypothetical protein